jgi:hypothetical protein
MRARDKKCGWTILVGTVLMASAACILANAQAATPALAEEYPLNPQQAAVQILDEDSLLTHSVR